MGGTLPAVVAVALVQGTLLRSLHHLAQSDAGAWSKLSFLLPAYACTVGVPLVGRLQAGHYQAPESLRPELLDRKVQPLAPSPFGGLRIGENEFSFTPCAPEETACAGKQ